MAYNEVEHCSSAVAGAFEPPDAHTNSSPDTDTDSGMLSALWVGLHGPIGRRIWLAATPRPGP
jgi:hypothetical protein